MLETPIAFLIFNRPDTTRRVFAEIARAKPKKLLVIADGPRHEAEAEKCQAARAVIDEIDWDCKLLTNFSDVNLGCKRRVSSGLDWVFEQCEEAIILEDDCLPHPSFFRFCAELLDRYRDDERVMTISGNNFIGHYKQFEQSYFFSCYPSIWGWASWRRAWRYFDIDLKAWKILRSTAWLEDVLNHKVSAQYWQEVFDSLYNKISNGQHGTEWDYFWMLSCWAQNGLAAIPSVNLVSNIGFGVQATTTREHIATMAAIPVAEIEFPLKHPAYPLRDSAVDLLTFKQTNPWVIAPPGLYFWLRQRLLPFAPESLRGPIYKIRRKLKLSGVESA